MCTSEQFHFCPPLCPCPCWPTIRFYRIFHNFLQYLLQFIIIRLEFSCRASEGEGINGRNRISIEMANKRESRFEYWATTTVKEGQRCLLSPVDQNGTPMWPFICLHNCWQIIGWKIVAEDVQQTPPPPAFAFVISNKCRNIYYNHMNSQSKTNADNSPHFSTNTFPYLLVYFRLVYFNLYLLTFVSG